AELDDPRVAARPRRIALGQVEKDLLDEIDLRGLALFSRATGARTDAEARDVGGDGALGREAARLVPSGELGLRRVSDRPEAARLGDQALRHAAQLLGLRVGRLDL